jgi:hypothetical protein
MLAGVDRAPVVEPELDVVDVEVAALAIAPPPIAAAPTAAPVARIVRMFLITSPLGRGEGTRTIVVVAREPSARAVSELRRRSESDFLLN